MKCGIMSMQRVYNYGSFLQAYALKNILEELGHEVIFVDYKVEPCIVQNKENIFRKYARMLKNRILYYPNKSVSEEKQDNLDFSDHFINEMFPLLGINEQRTERAKVDCLIIGSDEVFNCLQTNKDVGYSKELFGWNNNAGKVISFAASFGNTTLEGLREFKIDSEISRLLAKFDMISVRDKNSMNIVKELTGITPELHLDPVFHYNYDHLIPEIQKQDPYLAVYAYPYRIKAKEAEQIKKFAAKKGLKVFCFAGPQADLGVYKNVSAFEMLSYIRNAEYVVTDTFHGTVFSIKYDIPFVSIVRQTMARGEYGNAEKILFLLETLGLQNRILESCELLEKTIEYPINSDEVHDKIKNYVIRGLDYLKRGVQNNG